MSAAPDTSPNIYQKVIFGTNPEILSDLLHALLNEGWCVTSVTGCEFGFAVLLHRYPPMDSPYPEPEP